MLPYRIHSYGGTYKASDNFPVKKISLLFLKVIMDVSTQPYIVAIWCMFGKPWSTT